MSLTSVVVVGGGFAGSGLARKLSSTLDPKTYQVTLINSRPFAVHLIAGLRMTVDGNSHLENTALIPYDRLLGKAGVLKIGTVVGIEETSTGGDVVLASGERVSYSYLVFAPGSHWEGPLDFPDDMAAVKEHLATWRQKFARAKDVVIVGGGAVGTELAGEVKDLDKTKNVTIVHGSNLLANDAYSQKFRSRIVEAVSSRGVKLVLNDYVDDVPAEGSTSVTTRNGQKIPADLVVLTRGGRPNTEIIQALDSSLITPTGHVLVEPTLQLKGHPHIFAAGDIIEWHEQRQAAKAAAHGAVVAANIAFLLTGKGKLAPYKGSPEAILITNGKNGGVASLPLFGETILGSFVSSRLKSRGLLVGYFRKGFGY